MAAFAFVSAATLYGLAEGGYFTRTATVAAGKMSTLVQRAGFAVNRVTIEGQNRTRNGDIIKALGIDQKSSTLAFDTLAAQDRLELLPLVRSAQVMRLLPSQLHVVIEERVPYAIWQNKKTLHLVDQDGTVIDTLHDRSAPDLPLVVGEGAATHARELLDELAHHQNVKSKLQAAIRVADRRWNLKLVNGLEIWLPETETGEALKKIEELDQKKKILSSDAVFVDLRLADRITIRLGSEGASRRDSSFEAPVLKSQEPGRRA